MSLIDNYKNKPVSAVYGVGNFVYTCVLDTSLTGIKKVNIYANNINEAMYIVGCTFGNILSYNYLSNDILNLVLDGYPDGTCILCES